MIEKGGDDAGALAIRLPDSSCIQYAVPVGGRRLLEETAEWLLQQALTPVVLDRFESALRSKWGQQMVVTKDIAWDQRFHALPDGKLIPESMSVDFSSNPMNVELNANASSFHFLLKSFRSELIRVSLFPAPQARKAYL